MSRVTETRGIASKLLMVAAAFSVATIMSTGKAEALFVNGQLGWTGTGVLAFSTGGGAPGTNFIDWCPVNVGPDPAVGCGVNPNGLGATSVTTTTGTFTGINPIGGAGTILDITDDPPPTTAPYTFVPVEPTAANIAGFFNFPDPWLYTLTLLDNQTLEPCGGFCTPYFEIVQTGSNVGVNMSGSGTILAAGDISTFTFLITGNFPNTTIAQVVAAAASPTGIFSGSWSGIMFAQGAPTIPEPAIMLMFGVGSGVVVAMRRRRAKKAAQVV